MRRSRVFLPWSLLAGLLALAVTAHGLKATALVLGKLRQGQTSTTTDVPTAEGEEGVGTEVVGEGADKSEDGNSTAPGKHLTGIPQKDYILDPNLPRELNGYNLTEYPFYDRVPEEMDFKCDGLHDGFYASVEHKCQVYHHCLFGTRYDFLCANYTAFDQKTFICHFVSEVDCNNSPKYFKRNEALYKAATTTTVAPPRTTAPPPPAPARRPQQQQQAGRRKRPYSRPRRPVYDYYYDEDYEEDQEYYDDEVVSPSGKGAAGRRTRKHPRRPEDLADDSLAEDTPVDPKALYDRPRVPPKIRRPVPLNERDKYDYGNRPTLSPPPSTSTTTTTTTTTEEPTTSTRAKIEDDYYDEEEEYIPPARSRPKNKDYYPPTAGGVERDIVRRPPMSGAGRPIRRRPAGGRRRPHVDYDDYYDYDFEDEPPRRPSRTHRKRPRQPERTYTSQRSGGRYDVEEEDEPIPASRPSYITSAGSRASFRKRPAQQADPVDDYRSLSQSSSYKRPLASRKQVPSRYVDEADDEYYDDELIEDERVYRRQRPSANSRVSYQQDEIPTAPSRSSTNNKRPFTSPGRTSGVSSSSSRTSQIAPKNVPQTEPEIIEDRSAMKIVPSQQQTRPKPEPDLSIPPRPAFRPKSTTTSSPIIEEISDRSTNFQKPVYKEEPLAELPARVPPSSYGTFRSKLSQPDRDSSTLNGNSKSRPSVSDSERVSSISSPAPPPVVKDNYEEVPPSRIRPVKVLVKPVERNPIIPDDIPERQNLADIIDHDYDVTLNDALHPTLHPARNIEQPQRPFLPKVKSNYVTRAVNSQLGDEATTLSGRRAPSHLQASASQAYVTRTALPLHDKYDSTTDSSYRAYRPTSQYEEVRYRDQDEVPRYQQRASWSRREPSGGYYTN